MNSINLERACEKQLSLYRRTCPFKIFINFLLIYLFYFILYAHVQEYQMYKDHKNKLRKKKEGIISDLTVV